MINYSLSDIQRDIIVEKHAVFYYSHIKIKMEEYTKGLSGMDKVFMEKVQKDIGYILFYRTNDLKKYIEFNAKEAKIISLYNSTSYICKEKFNKIFSYEKFRDGRKSGYFVSLFSKLKRQMKITPISSGPSKIIGIIEISMKDINEFKIKIGLKNKIFKIDEMLGSLKEDMEILWASKSVTKQELYNSIEKTKEKVSCYYNWNAIEFIKLLDLHTCPYCNRLPLSYFTKSKWTINTDLDHFFDREQHPYFQLSILNLIPSCSICNRNMKLRKKAVRTKLKEVYYNYDNNMTDNKIYSLINPLDGNCIFSTIAPNEEISIFNLVKTPTYEIRVNRNLIQNKNEKFLNNVDVFRIEDVYKQHFYIIQDIIDKYDELNNTYFKESVTSLKNAFGSLNVEQAYIKLFSAEYNSSNYHNKINSKLIRDISNEFNITKLLVDKGFK